MKLKEIKVTDLKEGKKYSFVLPVGSTEQHGPFLPFGTDTYITDKLVKNVEKKFPELIVLPTLEYSRSKEHSEFYGTVWLTEKTLLAVLYDICKSIYKNASHIFLTSFHANDQVFAKFIELYQKDFGDTKITILQMCDEKDDVKIKEMLNGPIDDHAGNTEISNMLAIDEKLVTIPLPDYPKEVIIDPFEFDDLRKKSKSGIADNHPRWVMKKEIGEKILQLYTQKMTRDLEKYLKN